jgi:sugar phosphate isomerase/epimerase
VILGIQEPLVPGATAAERLARARDAGFDGLEVRDARAADLPAGITSSCPDLWETGWLGDFDGAHRRRALARLREELDALGALGGHGVITPAAWGMFSARLPAFGSPPRTPAEDREVLVAGLADLGEHARRAGTLLLLEPINRYEDHMVNTVAQACALVDAAGSPGVRVLADTYHMNIEEDDLCAALRAAGDRLGAVHLSDSGRGQPGTGHVDFTAVAATLRAAGFDGVASVECRLRGQPDHAVRACGRYLRGLLDAAASA